MCVYVCVFLCADLSASAGSKVVVITANAWNNEQSFVSVVQTNVDLYGKIIPSLARLSPNAVLLIASQPGQSSLLSTVMSVFSILAPCPLLETDKGVVVQNTWGTRGLVLDSEECHKIGRPQASDSYQHV